jgi:hypothetical protein
MWHPGRPSGYSAGRARFRERITAALPASPTASRKKRRLGAVMAEESPPTSVGPDARTHFNTGRVVLVCLAGVGLLAAAGVVVALRSWRATEEVVQTVAAPDAAHVARVISVTDPGTSGRHYLVLRVGRLGSQGQVSDDSGAFWLENAPRLALRWTAPRRLTVEFPSQAVIDGRKARVGIVQMTYLPVDTAQIARDQGGAIAPAESARGAGAR